MTTLQRYHYYHQHPRNFANECNLVKVLVGDKDSADEAEAEGFDRLSRAEALRHISWINSENESWGSNRAIGVMRLLDVEDYESFATYDRRQA
mgnify:CR=1 FL=1